MNRVAILLRILTEWRDAWADQLQIEKPKK
jgi:hypothetical protein